MSEYLVKGETLTALADAFRAKTGSSDSFTIQQMTNMVENGGVSAPPTYYFEFATFDAKTASYTINHNLGFVPQYACYFVFPYELEPGEDIEKPSGMRFAGGVAYRDDIYYSYLYNDTFQFTKGVTLCKSISDTQAVISPYGSFQTGYTYGFVFWGKPSEV